MKFIMILSGILLVLSGCSSNDTVTEVNSAVVGEVSSEISSEVNTSHNASVMRESLDVSETKINYLVKEFEKCGIGDIESIYSDDTGKVYMLYITNIDGNTYTATLSYKGYLGYVKDSDGNMLLMNID